MKLLVHICAGIAVICIGIILVSWHFMTRKKNQDRTAPAREARWSKKEPETIGNPEFKSPNGQEVLNPLPS